MKYREASKNQRSTENYIAHFISGVSNTTSVSLKHLFSRGIQYYELGGCLFQLFIYAFLLC